MSADSPIISDYSLGRMLLPSDFKNLNNIGLDVVSTGQPELSIFQNMETPIAWMVLGHEFSEIQEFLIPKFSPKKKIIGESRARWNILLETYRAAHYAMQLVNEYCSRPKKYKIAITGPLTMATYITGFAGDQDDSVSLNDVVQATLAFLRQITKDDQSKYLHHIQIDEPMLTRENSGERVKEAVKALKLMIAGLRRDFTIKNKRKLNFCIPQIYLHICGPIDKIGDFPTLIHELNPDGVHFELAHFADGEDKDRIIGTAKSLASGFPVSEDRHWRGLY